LDAQRDPGIPDGSGRRQRRRRKWIIGALVLAVLAATSAYVTANEVQANTEFDQTHHSLDVTRQHLDTVLADLVTVQRELDVVNRQIGTDSTALAQDSVQLQTVQKALANSQRNITRQTSTIGDLHTCLGGVEQSSNALAVGDQKRAINALVAVSTSCTSSVASDG
jgi:septal ring factor EnvC (AmiA/AmiB activator)